MAGQYIVGQKVVGFKEETTAGTYNAVSASDFDILMFEVTPIEWDYHMNKQGKPANGKLTTAQSKSGIITGGFTGKTRLQYSGDQGVAPNQGKLLTTTGLVESGSGSQIVYTYDGSSTCTTLSVLQSDTDCGSAPAGIDKSIRGVQSDLVISAPGVGQEITTDYTFAGAYEDEDDNASPITSLSGVDTGDTEKLLSTVFTLGGQTYILHNFTIALGNTVSMIQDPSKNGGVFQYKVTNTDCKFTAQVQKLDLTTYGLNDDVIADTVFNPITIAGTHWDFTITDANIISRKDGDAEGIIAEDLELEVRAFTMTQND